MEHIGDEMNIKSWRQFVCKHVAGHYRDALGKAALRDGTPGDLVHGGLLEHSRSQMRITRDDATRVNSRTARHVEQLLVLLQTQYFGRRLAEENAPTVH